MFSKLFVAPPSVHLLAIHVYFALNIVMGVTMMSLEGFSCKEH
jgi:hypothetical protein